MIKLLAAASEGLRAVLYIGAGSTVAMAGDDELRQTLAVARRTDDTENRTRGLPR